MARQVGCSFCSIHLLAVLLTILLARDSFAQNCGPLADDGQCEPGHSCNKVDPYLRRNTDADTGVDCMNQDPPAQSILDSVESLVASTCLQKNGIAVGWLPDQDDKVQITAITSVLNRSACYYGLYSQINSLTYDDSQLTGRMADIKASGAILQAAVMPSKVKFTDITTNLASQIAASMKKFTDNGMTVWLRFAHEMNYYVYDGEYAGGTPAQFIQAWKNVANAVKSNQKVKMFWCPNQPNGDGSTPIAPYWPGPDYVDIVGIDIYPNNQDKPLPSFSSAYGSFIATYSTPYNIPFAIAETATTVDSYKSNWLTELSSASSKSSYPTYVGFSWFEYVKNGKDFTVVTGSKNYAKSILT